MTGIDANRGKLVSGFAGRVIPAYDAAGAAAREAVARELERQAARQSENTQAVKAEGPDPIQI